MRQAVVIPLKSTWLRPCNDIHEYYNDILEYSVSWVGKNESSSNALRILQLTSDPMTLWNIGSSGSEA